MPRPTDSAPCGSKSTSKIRRPSSASAAPRLIVVVVLPTPPFWLQTATTRAGPCLSSGSGSGNTGSGRPVGPMMPALASVVLDADTVTSTSQATAHAAGRCLPDFRACIGSRQADSPFARKRVRSVLIGARASGKPPRGRYLAWSGRGCLFGIGAYPALVLASAESARMCGRVYLAQLVHRHQRVDLRG